MSSDVKFSNPCLYVDKDKSDFPGSFLRFDWIDIQYSQQKQKNGLCTFTFKLHLKCKPIVKFILDGVAEVRLKIHASKTKHRVVLPLNWIVDKFNAISDEDFEVIGTITEEFKNLYGPFSITGLIVMTKAASLDYEIDSDIIPIELMPSQILGYAEIAKNFEIPREELSIHNGSIFCLQKDSSLEPGTFKCALEMADKLTIHVAEDSFNLVNSMMRGHQKLFKAAVLSPVMISLLSQLYVLGNSQESYADYSWYASLCREMNGIGLVLSNMTDDDMDNVTVHVSKLLNAPLTTLRDKVYDEE